MHHFLKVEHRRRPKLYPEQHYMGQAANGEPEHLNEVPLVCWLLG